MASAASYCPHECDGHYREPVAPAWWPNQPIGLTLEITNVRVERVQDISEADAIAEGWKGDFDWPGGWGGCPKCGGYGVCGPTNDLSYDCPFYCATPQGWFAALWQSIYGNWDANPWVFAYDLTTPAQP